MKRLNSLPWLYLLLGFSQSAHSVEEVLTRLWMNMTVVTTALHERIAAIPVLTYSGEGFAAANLVIVALMLGFSPFPFQNHVWAKKIVRIIGWIEIVNGLMHLVPALVMGRYYSGCVSAIGLLCFGVLIVLKKEKPDGDSTI